MRISQRNHDTLVLTNRPWLTIAVFSLVALGGFALAVSAFTDGERVLGLFLGIMAVGFAFGAVSSAVFEQVRLDRPNGVVVISGRGLFRAWNERFALSQVKGARVLSVTDRGRRRRETFAPALVLRDPEDAEIPLTIVFAQKAPARRAANAITDWLRSTDQADLRPAPFAGLLPTVSLLAVNLSAAVPVLSGYWTIWELMVFYWVELLVVSVLFSASALIQSFTCDTRPARAYAMGLILLVGWVGWWVWGTYMSLQELPGLRGQAVAGVVLANNDLLVPILAMGASHLLAFIGSMVSSGGIDLRGVERYGESPFKRIMLLAIVVIASPVVVSITGAPIIVLGMFVGVKLWLDWRFSAGEATAAGHEDR
ncbi:MAG: hypothetical protein JJU42_01160 [Rhodobacteraceae bacterium]|nr:hypothetical protein [Paracoccaceae bacterium]